MTMLPALLLAAAVAAATANASAQDHTSGTKAAARKAAPVQEDDKAPDISASTGTEFRCAYGNKLTIYRNAEDDGHIALRWKKRLLRLTRVPTTSGANRFENGKNGLVWIDIPTKGMLLDSKKGQQLASECQSREQLSPKS